MKRYADSDANDDWLKLLTIIFSDITRKEKAKMSYWEIKETRRFLIIFLDLQFLDCQERRYHDESFFLLKNKMRFQMR